MSSVITRVNSDHLRTRFSPDVSKGAIELIGRAELAQNKFVSKCKEIDSSPLLSPQGRSVEKARAWSDFEANMNRLRKEADGYLANLEQMRDKLLGSLNKEMSVADALVMEMRAREIRDYFRGGANEDIRVMSAYQEAVESGDDEMCEALENSPIQMLTDDVLREGLLRRLQKKDPDLSKKIDELEQVHASVTSTFGELMREATAATGYQPILPIVMHGKHSLEESELH